MSKKGNDSKQEQNAVKKLNKFLDEDAPQLIQFHKVLEYKTDSMLELLTGNIMKGQGHFKWIRKVIFCLSPMFISKRMLDRVFAKMYKQDQQGALNKRHDEQVARMKNENKKKKFIRPGFRKGHGVILKKVEKEDADGRENKCGESEPGGVRPGEQVGSGVGKSQKPN